MASNLSFKSDDNKKTVNMPRKKTVSRGLIVAFILLLLTLGAFALLKMQHSKLIQDKNAITEQIKQELAKLETSMSPEDADFVVRAQILEDDLYREYDSNDILGEIEKIMVFKNSDNSGNRVVLKSFQYNSGSKTKKQFDDGDATITSAGSITITADADTFDVMAQQIEAFKTSAFFDNVEVGSTDRDDKGRIIFTLTMDVVAYGTSPYESGEAASVNNEVVIPVEEPVETNPETNMEQTGDIVVDIDNDIDGDITVEENTNNEM